MTDILLINLPFETKLSEKMVSNFEFCPSIGLLQLYSYLTLNGYNAVIHEFTLYKMKKQEFLDYIDELQPRAIGISAYTENIYLAFKIAKAIKSRFPDIYIIIGGAHVSLSLKEFEESEYADFAVINEGESALVELLEAIITDQKIISFDEIEGIAYKAGSKMYVTKKRSFIYDLDVLPLPARDYYDIENYNNTDSITISTSRGCPNNCIYCAATALSGKKYRVRNIENVYLECVMLNNEVKDLSLIFVDDSFTIIKKRVYKFLDLIDKYNKKLNWNCESIATHMDVDLLDRLEQANIHSIQYGIESANQDVLNNIQKGVNIEYAEFIIKETQKRGILPILSFIIGHYCDTNKSIKETIEFLKRASSEYDAQVALSYNTPFPGTYQFFNKEKLGYTLLTEDYRKYTLANPIIETENFSEEDLINYMYEARPFENKKTEAINTVKYYVKEGEMNE